MTSIFRRDRIPGVLKALAAVLFFLLAVLFFICIGWYRDGQNLPKENVIGNRASNVGRLKEKGFPFSFLVIGDTHNSNEGAILIEKAMKASEPSFMILLGDIVNRPDGWAHRFFLTEMVRELKPSFPVFLVPGNHDIDYSGKTGKKEGRVTPEIYESLYGQRNFDFIFNDSLFVIFGIDGNNPSGYLDYLRNTLSQRAGGKRFIFIFAHHPPKEGGMAGSFSLPGEREFLSLLETYKVTSCFFGDFHGYSRTERKGTSLIVSGGGGTLKKWQPEWGKFHHLLKITVDENRVNEGILILQGQGSNLGWVLKKWIFVRFFPVIADREWILYALAVLFLLLGSYSVIIFFHSFLRATKR